MKAIVTKYLPPTETKGSRIKAMAEGVKSMTVSFDWTVSPDTNHHLAAKQLAKTFDWLCEPWDMASGWLPNGQYCHVFVMRKEDL